MVFNGFVDKHSIIPNLNLVDVPDLTKILKSKIFIHSNRQLRVVHIFLGYNPFSSSFQAPNYVIKARDPLLHQINVVVLGFLVPSPVPEGVQQIELSFQRIAEEGATPSQLAIKEEEDIVEVSKSKDDFEVFSHP